MITNLVPHGPPLIADMDTGDGGGPFKLCYKKKARNGTLNANRPQKMAPKSNHGNHFRPAAHVARFQIQDQV